MGGPFRGVRPFFMGRRFGPEVAGSRRGISLGAVGSRCEISLGAVGSRCGISLEAAAKFVVANRASLC